MGMRASLATQKPFSRKSLEFHNLNVWDSGYGYDRVRMNQPIVDGRIHYLSTNKIQHVSANHQNNRLCQTYNRAPVELRLRSQFQQSLPSLPAPTLPPADLLPPHLP